MARRKIEGYWTCSYCGTKGIGGLTKTCPDCGHPQSEGLKFSMADGPKKYLEPEIAKDYGKGADWVCAYCESYNRYNQVVCKNCGAARTDAKHDYFGNAMNQDPIDVSEDSTFNAITSQSKKSQQQVTNELEHLLSPCNEEEVSTSNKGQPFWKNIDLKVVFSILGGAVAIIALILLLISIFTPRMYNAQVCDKSWNRSITIQELRTLDESDWEVPLGGRVYDERQEIRDYDHVIDHYDTVEHKVPRREIDHYEYEYSDNGDGTFDEEEIPIYNTVYDIEYEKVPVYKDVPIYDTKYYYKIDRWCYDRTETSSGKTDTPYWPEYNLGYKERESGKSETYTIYFEAGEKKSYFKSVSYEQWKEYDLGEKYHITVVAGLVTEVVPLSNE